MQVKTDLHFQRLKVKFSRKSSFVGFGYLLSGSISLATSVTNRLLWAVESEDQPIASEIQW